jgi:uncharacterized protein (TIGR02996 family)
MAVDPVLDMLLADIIAHPDDDGPRLAFADRLEETGADDARAAFVRVQVELAKALCHQPRAADESARTPYSMYCNDTLCRHCELDRVAGRLFRGDWDAEVFPETWQDSDEWPTPVYLRGFIGEVRLPCKAWLRHGPALVRVAPLTRVRLSDRAPNPVDRERRRHYWWHGDLPAGVYRLMACDDAQPAAPRERPNWKRYPGLAAAESAASDALLAWARAVASAGAPA